MKHKEETMVALSIDDVTSDFKRLPAVEIGIFSAEGVFVVVCRNLRK
jgi:hypothetical protein